MGEAPLGKRDGDAETLGKLRAVLNIGIVGGVVEKRRDIFDGIVMPVVGAEVSEKTISDGVIIVLHRCFHLNRLYLPLCAVLALPPETHPPAYSHH